jgi:thiol:disulfide interchange protein DsbD
MKKKLFLFLMMMLPVFFAGAQIINPTHWSFSVSKKNLKAGDEAELVFKVKLDPTWHLYSNDFDPNLGPKVSVFKFNPSKEYKLIGAVKPIGAVEEYDEIFEGKVRLFHHHAEFRQKVKILAGCSISGSYETQSCSDKAGKCVDQDGDFSFGPFEVSGGSEAKASADKALVSTEKTSSDTSSTLASADSVVESDSQANSVTAVVEPAQGDSLANKKEAAVATNPPAEEESLWAFFLAAFLSGLVALLTPCVFPMIPMTVTFFTRQSKSRTEGISKAGLYGLCIIFLYVLIGTAVSRINGPEFANFVSTHWAPNVFFFLVFLLFGLSFLGLFEIVLPSSLVNMADRQSDKGGIYGIFFMAFTIVLVSFSCTGPIVGSILVESAGGAVLKPIIGMLGYSLAFALPFTLFAIFPQWLSSLPKSGGWLNSVKVVLGFLELAFALKFLSIADLAYHWRILDREVYLAAWIVIFSLMGFYLLGKIRLPHDSAMEKIPVMRLAMAIVVFSFVVYMIPGMWGAPLRALSGYLPPESTQDFRFQPGSADAGKSSPAEGLCDAPRHADILHLPHEIQGYFDLKQALACAKEKNKPVFIDFTGHGCVNCREMEANVWSQPEVLKRLKEDFIVTALYVDDKTELPQSEWYVSPYDQKEKKTIGKQNADLQVRDYQSNSQPMYVLLAPDGSLLVPPRSYDLDVDGFVSFLENGKTALKNDKTKGSAREKSPGL